MWRLGEGPKDCSRFGVAAGCVASHVLPGPEDATSLLGLAGACPSSRCACIKSSTCSAVQEQSLLRLHLSCLPQDEGEVKDRRGRACSCSPSLQLHCKRLKAELKSGKAGLISEEMLLGSHCFFPGRTWLATPLCLILLTLHLAIQRSAKALCRNIQSFSPGRNDCFFVGTRVFLIHLSPPFY